MRAMLIVLATMALAACNAKATGASLGQSDADASIEAPLTSARMLYQRGAYGEAQQALEPYAKAPTLYEFTPARRRELIDLYAQASWYGGDYKTAHGAWRVATEAANATPDEWRGRLMSAAATLDNQDAYLAFDHLRDAAPDAVRSIGQQLLQEINDGFGVLPNAETAHLQLAAVLFPVEETDPQADFNGMWLQAATASLQSGDRIGAAKYARRITSPLVMAQLRADRRFDALVAEDPSAYDVRGLAESRLERARARAAAEPGLVEPQLEVAAALHDLGRQTEALQVLDAGLRHGPAYGEDPGLGVSLATRKVTVLSALGRDDEAIAIASILCAVCGRHSNMQLAHLMLGAGRPADALQALENETPDGLSVQGVGELAAMRACADHGVGKSADAASHLEFLKQHLRGSPDAALGALVCAGSDDEVASTLILMLDDPLMRAVGLGDLQTYHEEKLSPFTTALRARLATIASRPAVKSAIDRVGRVATYNLPRYAVVG
jgi:hypothetical protein